MSSSFCGAGGDGPGEAGGESGGSASGSPVGSVLQQHGLLVGSGLGLTQLWARNGGRGAGSATRFCRRLGRADDRLRDPTDRLVTETCGGEQLLGALLGAGDDRAGLAARPLERRLDLGARGVREFGRLVAGLLEQPGRPRLRLRDLLGCLLLRLLRRVARLALGCVQQLGPLALAFLAVLLDVALALLQLTLAPRDLLLGAAQLRGRGGLRVAFDRVGHLRGGADHVHRVHPHRVAGRLGAALAGGLQHTELDLELGRVPAVGLECLADLLAVVAVGGARQVFDPRQRRQRRCL